MRNSRSEDPRPEPSSAWPRPPIAPARHQQQTSGRSAPPTERRPLILSEQAMAAAAAPLGGRTSKHEASLIGGAADWLELVLTCVSSRQGVFASAVASSRHYR